MGAFSHKFSVTPSGETTDGIKKDRGRENGTDLLCHCAKYDGDCGSRAGCRRQSVIYFCNRQVCAKRSNTGRSARSAAMSVLHLLSGPKMGFPPHGRHVAPINVKFGTGNAPQVRSPCQISRPSGQKWGNTAPKTGKIYNFADKFVPQGRLVSTIFTKFSAFVRVYR